ncbi:MAG: RNA methyltransferase [Hyphomicrobiaceae bacterium]
MNPQINIRNNEPVVAATGEAVATVVHRAHERGIDDAITSLRTDAPDGTMTKEQFEQILTYCAEQACTGAGAACRACRLHQQQAGIASLDAYVGQFQKVSFASPDLQVAAAGEGELQVPSLEWLAQNWTGEEYWFWARRVLRKLRYGIRQIADLSPPTSDTTEPPAIILVEPQIPENIGMVARAMGNFGLDDLRIVNPRDGWPSEKARAVASGAAAIIDGASLHDTVAGAIEDLNWVGATTARQRDMHKPILSPDLAAKTATDAVRCGEKCGIMFGRERNGLDSDEVALADAIIMIPINNRFASLNLAQSVLLLGYEWLKATGTASLGRVTQNEKPLETGLNLGSRRRASKAELIGLFEHLERALDEKGFFNPSHRRHVVVKNLRTMLTRMDATDQEVRTMRGIVATLSRTKDTG